MVKVREPAVAGQFYPAEAGRLRTMIDEFLRVDVGAEGLVRALIVPHAGYVYSGPIAGTGYAWVARQRDQIDRVVLLGPAHRVPVHGLAASSVDMFATPLGNVRLDKQALAALAELEAVGFHDAAHAPEHGLEVHLPFLQRLFGDFALVPLVVGDASQDDVASVLTVFANNASTLIVVSSDLSHYLDYDAAVRVDRNTSIRIEALRPLEAGQACGRNAINGLLVLARQRGWTARTVDLRNSGDTAGPHGQVVGYGAYVFLEAAGEAPAGS